LTGLDLGPLKVKVQTFKHEGPDSLLDPTSDTFNLQDYLEDLAFQSKGELVDQLQTLAYLIRQWPFDEIKFKIVAGEIFQPAVFDSKIEGIDEWLELHKYISSILFESKKIPKGLLQLVKRNLKVEISSFPNISVGRADIASRLGDFFDSCNSAQLKHFSLRYLESENKYTLRTVAPVSLAQLLHEILGRNYWKYDFDGNAHNFFFLGSECIGEDYFYAKTPQKNIAFPAAIVEGIINVSDLGIGELKVDGKETLPPQKYPFNGKIVEIDYQDKDFWKYPNLLVINNGFVMRAYSLENKPYQSYGVAINGYVKSPLFSEIYSVIEME